MTNARRPAIGDTITVEGSSSWLTPEPTKVIDFGEKNGHKVVDLANGQWCYAKDVRIVTPVAAPKRG